MNTDQLDRIRTAAGFIAALDQSGGSTPRALAGYGISESEWSSEEEMFDLVHAMRTRVITAPSFTSDHIIGAILFEKTMDRDIDGTPTASYLWNVKHVVPFLKIDQGLEARADGVALLKPIPELDSLLDRALAAGIFGTKERSVIYEATETGINTLVAQQIDLARQVCAKGLVPIIEPEVDIHTPDRDRAEHLLLAALQRELATIDQPVMLKLTIPETPNLYRPLMDLEQVVRVVALSGGFAQAEACERLAANTGLIASFSRALLEGLSAQQSDAEFNATLSASIERIAAASR